MNTEDQRSNHILFYNTRLLITVARHQTKELPTFSATWNHNISKYVKSKLVNYLPRKTKACLEIKVLLPAFANSTKVITIYQNKKGVNYIKTNPKIAERDRERNSEINIYILFLFLLQQRFSNKRSSSSKDLDITRSQGWLLTFSNSLVVNFCKIFLSRTWPPMRWTSSHARKRYEII